ncbi:hypothetical protein Tco_0257691 [Tanacetum coccineum]
MVAYLQKTEGSEAFHQIVDFLNASHIKYALIDNPKIYVSLIQQFWGTTTARTTDDGEVEITARIDGQVKTINEASLRRHLKLKDSDGITSLPNTENFEQLALMVADEAAFTSVDVDAGGAATTNIGLDAVHTLRSDEGSMQQNELMDLVTKLKDRVKVLENDLQQTKKVYSSAITKLIIRVKKLEKKVKSNKARRRARIVVSEDEDAKEDSSKQGRKIFKIDKDPTISLVQPEQDITASAAVTTTSAFISTASSLRVSTAEDISGAETLVYVRRNASKDKVKDTARQEQERYDFEKALELQKQLNQREKVVAKSQAHDIDWSDLAVLRYHAVQNRSFSIAEDSEIEKEVMKRSGFNLQQESSKQVEEEIVQQDDVVAEQVVKERSRKAKGRLKRKTSKARNDKDKIQKNQDDPEKLTLMKYVEVIFDSKKVINVIPLAVKSLIVSWKSYYKEDVGYYEIHRVDGSYKTYIFFSEMLNDFDREDLIVLYRLFNEKYASTRPVSLVGPAGNPGINEYVLIPLVKNVANTEHGKRRATKEAKIKTKPGKSQKVKDCGQLKSKKVKLGEKIVNSRFSLAHHQAKPRRKHKEKWDLLYYHSHNKYKGLNKDCQLGNPYEMKSDPRVDNEDPIIEKIVRI